MTPTSGHLAHCWHTAMPEPISLAILSTECVYNWHGVTTNEHSLHRHQATRHTAGIHARAHLVGHHTKGVYNCMEFLATSTRYTNIRPLGTLLAYSHARAHFVGHPTKGVYNWHGVTTNERSLHQHQATRQAAHRWHIAMPEPISLAIFPKVATTAGMECLLMSNR